MLITSFRVHVLVLGLFMLLLNDSIVQCQNQDTCAAVLSNATNVALLKTSEAAYSAEFYNFCSMTFQEFSSSKGAKAEGTYKLIGGKGEYNEQNYQQYKTDQCLTKKSSSNRSAAQFFYSQVLDPGAVSAWRDCMAKRDLLVCTAEARSGDNLLINYSWYGLETQLPIIKQTTLLGATSTYNAASAIPAKELLPKGIEVSRGEHNVVVERTKETNGSYQDVLSTIEVVRDGASYACDIFVPKKTMDLPTEAIGPPCVVYQLMNPDDVACNDNTADGYYWRVARKLEHYSVTGMDSLGKQPDCDSGHLNAKGKTARFPYTEQLFRPVYENYMNSSAGMTSPGCNYINAGQKLGEASRAELCGIFSTICLKQPEVPK